MHDKAYCPTIKENLIIGIMMLYTMHMQAKIYHASIDALPLSFVPMLFSADAESTTISSEADS